MSGRPSKSALTRNARFTIALSSESGRSATRSTNVAAEERRKNLAENRQLLDSVLSKVPAILGRADHEIMIAAWMESLDYEDFERLCERHELPFEETETEEDIRDLFRRDVSNLVDAEVSRFMMELALLPSGYSSNRLEETDRLMVAAKLYNRPRKRLAPVAPSPKPNRRPSLGILK
jgi:hypothetical protein